ncbi:Tetratricopeptide repeat-containing protein [Zunongwangia mangrovi]|uniref:Tetratricopeptide repeat-containing protein n=1 Tax=Zunongwangia mangrovi TaxID=1334022 RepID=A0A1I1NFC1_9FLAO|nr:tetratricopeptide repeat protein [Zunongwangia mangrovi]SFC96086.1 Tetratricopeptide repeat-containing protein [Zunongwangia mangrovi]
MNKLISLVFLFISLITFGQTYEEKIAKKSCECISKDSETENLNDLLKKCIVSSKIDVENNDTSEKDNRQFTVEGIRKTFSDVSKLVIEECPSLRTKVFEKKKQEFYRLSDNQKANEYFEKGNQLQDKEQFKLAIEQYEKAIKKDKKFVMAYDHLGVAYRMKNDLNKAIKTYKKSLEIFPEGDFALLNIAAIYSMKENETEAQNFYQNLINFYPENPEGYYGNGKTNLILGNNEIALKNTLESIILYKNQNSNKISDAENLLNFVHAKMKEDKELDKFNEIIKEYNFELKE